MCHQITGYYDEEDGKFVVKFDKDELLSDKTFRDVLLNELPEAEKTELEQELSWIHRGISHARAILESLKNDINSTESNREKKIQQLVDLQAQTQTDLDRCYDLLRRIREVAEQPTVQEILAEGGF